MVKKRRRTPSGRGRLSWDGRLWDPDGRVYAIVDDQLDRRAILDLLRNRDIQVAVSRWSKPLIWLDPDERMTVWTTQLAPDFHDNPNRRPPSAAGDLPVHAELWQSGERQVLLFNDRD